MREILFRGKRLDTGEWVEGGFAQIDLTTRIVGQGILVDAIHYIVDPATIGQFTGILDRNGNRIFEGDIVEQNWYDYDEPSDDSFGEVMFCEYDSSFSVMDKEKDWFVPLGRCHAYHWEAEVIGNIHDNPELMKGD